MNLDTSPKRDPQRQPPLGVEEEGEQTSAEPEALEPPTEVPGADKGEEGEEFLALGADSEDEELSPAAADDLPEATATTGSQQATALVPLAKEGTTTTATARYFAAAPICPPAGGTVGELQHRVEDDPTDEEAWVHLGLYYLDAAGPGPLARNGG